METIKTTLFLTCFIALALFIDWIRVEYNIPITLMDLILLTATLLLYFILFQSLRSTNSKEHDIEEVSLKNLIINLAVSTTVALPIGVFGIWLGVTDPFNYTSGVKADGHAYTLVPSGFLLLMWWVYSIWQLYKKLTFKNRI